MIPLKLELTNFLSYQTTATLDFGGIALACISGQNGAGKSSLLEGMIWALFGKSRASSDDDVVNRLAAVRGETAEVRFMFALEEAVYRVIRKKKRSGRASLEFQLQSGDSWRSMSETKMRETQATIEQTLNMNYDTFINVSFFLQGAADAFTTQTAAKRKEILAELLGVNQWDIYKEKAAEKRKALENDLRLLDGRMGDIETELLEREEREAILSALQAQSETLKVTLNAQEQLVRQLRQAADALTRQQQLISTIQQEQTTATDRTTTLQTTLDQRQTQRTQYTAILADKATIATQKSDFDTYQAQADQWQEKADLFHGIIQAQRPHELAIAQQRSRLTTQKETLSAQADQVAQLQTTRQQLATTLEANRAQQAETDAQLATLADVETAHQTTRERLQAAQHKRQLLTQQATQLAREAQAAATAATAQTELQKAAATSTAEITRLTMAADKLNTDRIQLTALKTEAAALTTSEQPRLNDLMQKLKERMDRLKASTGELCPLCGQPLTESHLSAVLGELQQEGTTLGNDYRANQKRLSTMTEEMKELDGRIRSTTMLESQLQKHRQQLAQAEAQLAEAERTTAAWQAQDGAAKLANLQTQLADESTIAHLQTETATLNAQLTEKTTLTRARQQITHAITEAETKIAAADTTIAEWETTGTAALAAVTTQLADDAFAPEARAALAQLQAEAAAIGYDKAAHDNVRQQLDALADAPARWQALQTAEAAIEPLDTTIADLTQQLSEQQETAATLHQRTLDEAARLTTLQADAGDLRAAEETVTTLREQQIDANRKVGSAQQRVAVLDDLGQSQITLRADRVTLTERIQQLKQLEKACGRDGIQALLIEQALPTIEENANELLDRLSDGQMRVGFQTQRALKSKQKELRETLDIHITDNSGERSYENFSGGEQFRINFAIRLALSKLLAQRAGARLQTLVIDEGFGSQDPTGRQRLVEAINVIKPEFERILVITHIDELREAFPTRIEVRKARNGSQIAVI